MTRRTVTAAAIVFAVLFSLLQGGSPAVAAPAAPATVPAEEHIVTAANIAVEPGTSITTVVTPNAYPIYCRAYGVAPYLGTVQGVQVIFLPNDILYHGYRCEIGKASLRMQSDGNLVVYDENNIARYATSWFRDVIHKGQRAEFQGFDGNFVEYNNTNNYSGALWESGTCCRTGARLAVQADGNVVVYDSALRALWATHTNH